MSFDFGEEEDEFVGRPETLLMLAVVHLRDVGQRCNVPDYEVALCNIFERGGNDRVYFADSARRAGPLPDFSDGFASLVWHRKMS